MYEEILGKLQARDEEINVEEYLSKDYETYKDKSILACLWSKVEGFKGKLVVGREILARDKSNLKVSCQY